MEAVQAVFKFGKVGLIAMDMTARLQGHQKWIQEELERISITVETLQLWCEKMLDNGIIDIEQYNAYRKGDKNGG